MGPLAVVLPKYAASLAFEVADQAVADHLQRGGELSAANSAVMTVNPADLLGVTLTSVNVGSVTLISAPSAVHAAVGSADTTGTLKSWLLVEMVVLTCAATDVSMSGRTTSAPTCSADRMLAPVVVVMP